MSSGLVFRRDIAGLRAVAVIGVLLFHLGFSWIPGGFAGVDIFFVISGYLITSILLRDVVSGEFSFFDFYLRRVKRLLPAALVVMLFSLFAGYFLLDPAAYEDLASSALYASFFSANIYFYLNSGYFDPSSEESPLLHMWSLGVEEQFYIFFPLIVLAFFFLGRRFAFWGLTVLFVASFILCLVMANHDPMFGFYMFPMRAWELGVGCLLAFSTGFSVSKNLRRSMVFLGLGLVVGALFVLNKELIYPSYWAVIPVLGTALLIHFGREDSLSDAVLGCSAMQFVGKISYSVYLWHWPVIVFFRTYWSGKEVSAKEAVLLFLVSLFLGWLSWRFIEEKFRRSPSSPRVVFGSAGIATFFVLALASSILFMNGLGFRGSQDTDKLTDLKKMWEWTCEESKFVPGSGPSCVVGSSWAGAKKRGVIWGDSHSEHLAAVLDLIGKQNDVSVVIAPRSCPPYLNLKYINYVKSDNPLFGARCSTKQEMILKWINESDDIDFIIMAAAWSGHGLYLSSLDGGKSSAPDLMHSSFSALLQKIKLDNRRLVFLGEIPRLKHSYNSCAAVSIGLPLRRCSYDYRNLDYGQIKAQHEPYNKVLSLLASEWQAQALLPSETMCTESSCETVLSGEFIYRDNNHLRRNLTVETNSALADVMGLRVFFESL